MGILDFFNKPKVMDCKTEIVVKTVNTPKKTRSLNFNATTKKPPTKIGYYFYKANKDDYWHIVTVVPHYSGNKLVMFYYNDTSRIFGLDWVTGLWSQKNIPFPKEKKNAWK